MFEQSDDVDRDCKNCVTPNVEVFNVFSFQKKIYTSKSIFFWNSNFTAMSYRQMTDPFSYGWV